MGMILRGIGMKSCKKWLLLFGGVLLAGLVAIAALVIYVDPFFQYHKPLSFFPYKVDNQLSQNPGMARRLDYDSVLLGSSMTASFDTDWFTEVMGLQTVKLSYNGAFPKDEANIMDIIFDTKGSSVKKYLWQWIRGLFLRIRRLQNIPYRNIYMIKILLIMCSIFLIKMFC